MGIVTRLSFNMLSKRLIRDRLVPVPVATIFGSDPSLNISFQRPFVLILGDCSNLVCRSFVIFHPEFKFTNGCLSFCSVVPLVVSELGPAVAAVWAPSTRWGFFGLWLLNYASEWVYGGKQRQTYGSETSLGVRNSSIILWGPLASFSRTRKCLSPLNSNDSWT